MKEITLKGDPVDCKDKFAFYGEDADLLSNLTT